MSLPKTLMQLAGLPATPHPLAESALLLIDLQAEYRDGVLALPGVGPATGEAAAPGRFHVSWEALGRVLSVAEGPLEDVAGVDVVTHAYVNGVPQTALELTAGVKSHNLGRGLHSSEQRFVAELVRECLVEAAKAGETGSSGTGDGGGRRALGEPARRPEPIKSRL